MLTRAEIEQAVVDGDWYCQCGYRKSLHGSSHPAQDPARPGHCNAPRSLTRSVTLNEAVMLHRPHAESTLFAGEEA